MGSLALDTIVRGTAPPASRLGGAVTYAGLTYRRLGLDARAAFNLAAGDRAAPGALVREGVALHIGPSAETTRFVNRLEGERRTQEVPSRSRPIAAGLVAEALADEDGTGCAIVHLGPLHADDVEVAAADVIARSGARVALDVQGLVRRVGPTGVTHVLREGALPFLRCCHVLKGDEDEIEALLRGLGVEVAVGADPRAELFRRLDLDELVVTAGSRGGVVLTRADADARFPYEAEPPHDQGDSTGAGDVFLAAYMTARFARALDVRAAAREAARVAARQVVGEWIEVAALAI